MNKTLNRTRTLYCIAERRSSRDSVWSVGGFILPGLTAPSRPARRSPRQLVVEQRGVDRQGRAQRGELLDRVWYQKSAEPDWPDHGCFVSHRTCTAVPLAPRPPLYRPTAIPQAASRVYRLNHAIVRIQASSAATWL